MQVRSLSWSLYDSVAQWIRVFRFERKGWGFESLQNYMKIRKGNSANSKLNGEWGKHVRADGKKITSGKRRMANKEIIREELNNLED